MSWLSDIVGTGIGGLADGVASAIDRFVETDEEKRAAEILKKKVDMEPAKWNAEINKIEARHRSVFVAGWRPAIGWTCAIGLFWVFVGSPVVGSILAIAGVSVVLPVLNAGELMTLVLAMLGFGAYRTYEKKEGVTG